MTFQHLPEHFNVDPSPRRRESMCPDTTGCIVPGRPQPVQMIMVQTPMGAAMLVPVKPRPNQMDPVINDAETGGAVAKLCPRNIPVLSERDTGDASSQHTAQRPVQRNAVTETTNVLVAAAPSR